VLPHTLRDRLRRGYTVEQAVRPYPVHDSVEQFYEASCVTDWVGMSINDLYEIYWKWSVSHGFTPTTKQGFGRQLKSMNPAIKTVPTQKGEGYKRIIRLREV
jgi:phage/plasmid-associated DNA primase